MFERMPMLSPISETLRGLKAYWEGVRWLRERPRFLVLLTVPGIAGLLAMIGGITLFAKYDQAIIDYVLFAKPDAWYLLALYYICRVLLYLAVIVLAFVGSLLVANVVASPIYEIVSTAVEKDITGVEPEPQSLGTMLRVMLVELKKVVAILLITVVLLLIPGLNVLSTLFAAFLVGWDFFDYPLARRGYSLKQRFDLVRGEGFAVLGFGFWLVIPFVSLVLLPLAIAGGTMLNIEAMKKRRLLTPSTSLLRNDGRKI